MIKKIWMFLGEYGHGVMLLGMAIVISAVVLLVGSRQGGAPVGPFVWPVAIVGVCIYAAGRVALALRNKPGPRRPERDDIDTP